MRTATCGEARYNRKKETTELLVNPRIIDESNRILSGNKISLFYDNDQLNKLYIPENASAYSTAYGYSCTDLRDELCL